MKINLSEQNCPECHEDSLSIESSNELAISIIKCTDCGYHFSGKCCEESLLKKFIKSITPKKNCHNCKHGYFDSDGEYGEYKYFVCEKRVCESTEHENNLHRPEYLEHAKVCCELREQPVKVECIECGSEELAWKEHKDNFVCMDCYCCNKMKDDKNA